jgi:hypothetical protein
VIDSVTIRYKRLEMESKERRASLAVGQHLSTISDRGRKRVRKEKHTAET